MLQAVLLDLDNTLLIFDEPGFYARFFKALAPHVHDLMSAETLQLGIMRGINILQTQPGDVSNRELFLDHFMAATGCDRPRTEIWERFDEFYATIYGEIPVTASPAPALSEVMADFKSKNIPLALATNPIFPEKAQLTRLSWTGLQPTDFELVTTIENMFHAKPQIQYFLDICQQMQVAPEACLMVGNDRANDMAAGAAGLKTYLTTDAAPIDYSSMAKGKKPPPRPKKKTYPADFTGPLADLPKIVSALKDRND